MNERESFFDAIGGEIEEILRGYVAVPSVTGTDGEREATRFFLDFFSAVPYFRAHRDHCGAHPLPGDSLDRSVAWALVKGRGRETVVLIHHSDVVGVEDFRRCREEAFSPVDLERALLALGEELPEEARRDLESGRFLFGRGSCDMKGGGAIQMALLRRWSLAEREGNLLLLALPDEENLSAGMRAALRLLLDLREKWGLDYRLMIDSEPHQRKDPERGLLSAGSVGKLMPFVYVRGSLSHAGKVFEGFNPLNLLCAVVRKTEGSPSFIDCRDGEASPPPTWLHLKDGKERYDVSMPLSAYGYFSVLTLGKEPAEVLEQVRQVCLEAFGDVLSDLQGSWDHFCRTTGRSPSSLSWRPRVMSFGELLDEARRRGGDSFERSRAAREEDLKREMLSGRLSLAEGNRVLIEGLSEAVDDGRPHVVYGLLPPYYPHRSNGLLPDQEETLAGLGENLALFARESWNQPYDVEAYYTGISDMSYSGIADGKAVAQVLAATMPLFPSVYDLPLEALSRLSMACINIGPWGKDFHKMTERVFREDLFDRTPRLLLRAIETVLGGERSPAPGRERRRDDVL